MGRMPEKGAQNGARFYNFGRCPVWGWKSAGSLLRIVFAVGAGMSGCVAYALAAWLNLPQLPATIRTLRLRAVARTQP